VPGLPFMPFILGASVLAIAAVLAGRVARTKEAVADTEVEEEAAPARKPLGDLIDVEEIHVRFAPSLVASIMEPGVGLESRIVNMRRHIATEYGFIIPEVRLTDDPMLGKDAYAIQIQGVEMGAAELQPGHVLVLLNDQVTFDIQGKDVKEPVYGAPARWIAETAHDDAAALGLPVVAPGEVVATHLLEVIQSNFGRLLTRRALRKLLDAFSNVSDTSRAEANRKLLDEYIPDKVPMDVLQGALRLLLEERVPIRNLPLILEAIAEARGSNMATDDIAEHVRRRIAFHIIARLSDKDGNLPLIQLAPEWEAKFAEHEHDDNGRPDVVLPPEDFNRLAGSVQGMVARATARSAFPAIATSARRRRFVRQVLSAKGIPNPVLSFDEIGTTQKLSLLGTA